MAEYLDLLTRTITALDKSQLKYVIVGGFAAILKGRPRTTMDLDIIIENDRKKIEDFFKFMVDNNFKIIDDLDQIFTSKENITIFDNLSILRIDLKIAQSIDELEVLNQAIVESYKDLNIRIASVEQILYGKLLFLGEVIDLSDSELLGFNDVLDFLSVYNYATSIDINWLKQKAIEKGLVEILNRLLRLLKTF